MDTIDRCAIIIVGIVILTMVYLTAMSVVDIQKKVTGIEAKQEAKIEDVCTELRGALQDQGYRF